jgi:serine/threonine protein kinase
MELAEGGELYDFIEAGRFSPKICRFYFKQILNAMHHAH